MSHPGTGESAPHGAADALSASRDERRSSGSVRGEQHGDTRSDERIDAASPSGLLHLLYSENSIHGPGTRRSSPRGLLDILYTSDASHASVSIRRGPRAQDDIEESDGDDEESDGGGRDTDQESDAGEDDADPIVLVSVLAVAAVIVVVVATMYAPPMSSDVSSFAPLATVPTGGTSSANTNLPRNDENMEAVFHDDNTNTESRFSEHEHGPEDANLPRMSRRFLRPGHDIVLMVLNMHALYHTSTLTSVRLTSVCWWP